jgi:ferredoxin-nitrite reductase
MMRLRQHNGIITAKQMRYLGEVIQSYGEDGCADITTRQNIQLRGVVLPDVPEMFENFAKLGLSSTQVSGQCSLNPLCASLTRCTLPQSAVGFFNQLCAASIRCALL